MCKHHEDQDWSSRPAVVVKPQPPRPTAANISECSVATDSVVATATVRTDATMRRIVVNWGDGTVNTLRNTPGVETAVGQQTQLPAGTFKLRHVYQAPEDRGSFDQIVIIRVEDVSGGVDFCINKITVRPRYRVTNYRTTLSLNTNCDAPGERTSELDVKLRVEGVEAKAWRIELSQSLVPNSYVLDGSIVSRELTVADGLVHVDLDIVETDPLFNDYLMDTSMALSASHDSGRVSGLATGDGCEVGYSYDREVTLIAPMPSYGQTVVLIANP